MFGHPHKVKYGFLDGEVDLNCDADARPKPEFSWYRNGKKIYRNVENEENHSVLHVSSYFT
jgi:Immunoglobulin I-set domain